MNILVTGGAGFIGSAVCRHLATDPQNNVINFDKLTYAAKSGTLQEVEGQANYHFVQGDICDHDLVLHTLQDHCVDAIMHLAAESHVDRSIDGPGPFIETNILGTFQLLKATLAYWQNLAEERKASFRFHHISTDEVYGDLPAGKGFFTEETPYRPSSPYSASKAAADHLVRAWHQTYGLPVVTSNCSNNYGPYHFPEKLIPLMILNALGEKLLPIYGRGWNVRDWLYVEDHARALECVLKQGRIGESYNIGGRSERTNLSVVHAICSILDQKRPRSNGLPYSDLVVFVKDRPGHDRRYAVDTTKIETELGWFPLESFESGLQKTVNWYLDNAWWWEPIRSEHYCGTRIGRAA